MRTIKGYHTHGCGQVAKVIETHAEGFDLYYCVCGASGILPKHAKAGTGADDLGNLPAKALSRSPEEKA